ncbi:probable carboxylesterase 18 [Juglans microcarpa x Juglans regia]|uniref:probable carboxylesterase 18 n=1 Tax=Juglans microcarpa x Juglans regia TaxID=2249226 RepID=UPI001B7DC098|nr:probable carboxylesterase 18 [Juglans microcarpa x Juglans regia]
MGETDEETATPKPNLPWKLKLFLGAISWVIERSLRPNMTVNRRLINFFDPKIPPSPNPRRGSDSVASSDITVDHSRNLWFRLFNPSPTTSTGSDNGVSGMPIIVFYHGGGFAIGHANSMIVDTAARRLSRELRAIIVSVNYRLAPKHRLPCQYEDGFDVLRFIDEMDTEGLPANADLSRCFLAGESAGGNLAHQVAVRAAEHDFKRVNLLGLIAIQPFFGGEDRVKSEIRFSRGPFLTLDAIDWYWRAFLPEGTDRDHAAVNVFGPNAVDISGLRFPPTLLFIGGCDPLRDRNIMYYEGLKKSGKQVYVVEYPNAVHGFSGFKEIPESCLFLREVKDFMEMQMAKEKV